MRKVLSLLIILVLAMTLLGTSAFAASVAPDLIDNWTSGNAYFECQEIGCSADFAFKVDFNADPNNLYNCDGGNVITIASNASEGEYKSFDWTSVYPVVAVIVKAAGSAYVYHYDGAYSDVNLTAPYNKGISHVTFCYNKPDTCYKEETAWAIGDKYNTKGGNWAMYVTYDGLSKKVVNLRAAGGNGIGLNAGTATLEPAGNGQVNITIDLYNGFIFYYDTDDALYDNNIKIQGYDNPPKGNPSPGLFANKAHAESGLTSFTITVPYSKYYGIHLDVAYPISSELQ